MGGGAIRIMILTILSFTHSLIHSLSLQTYKYLVYPLMQHLGSELRHTNKP
jgi:hypothetical protein